MMAAGTASAMGLSQGTQPLDSIVGVSSASLSVNVRDGVATVFGNVESGSEAALAKAYVSQMDGVERVINLITVN
jgi:osmotically-inducible protein OsmY